MQTAWSPPANPGAMTLTLTGARCKYLSGIEMELAIKSSEWYKGGVTSETA
jgi:hypothetical protein